MLSDRDIVSDKTQGSTLEHTRLSWKQRTIGAQTISGDIKVKIYKWQFTIRLGLNQVLYQAHHNLDHLRAAFHYFLLQDPLTLSLDYKTYICVSTQCRSVKQKDLCP